MRSSANKKVYNFPFLMGEGVWIDSEKLGWTTTCGEVLKHGTLSIGFIGLAEALKALHRQASRREPARRRIWAWRSSATCASCCDEREPAGRG